MLNHRRSNDNHIGRTDHRTSRGRAGALLGAALAIVIGSVAWVGSIASSSADACNEAIDTYRLAEPGSYSVFARSPSGLTYLEVRASSGVWIARACDLVGRDLTESEWARYVTGDEPVQSACT